MIDLETVTALSRDVVLQLGRGLDVVSVTTTGGESERVEITVTIAGCHLEPCRFTVNVSRSGAKEFDRDFRGRLAEAIQKHAVA